jgi:hypothetical protein
MLGTYYLVKTHRRKATHDGTNERMNESKEEKTLNQFESIPIPNPNPQYYGTQL